jgi:hypothetical protein
LCQVLFFFLFVECVESPSVRDGESKRRFSLGVKQKSCPVIFASKKGGAAAQRRKGRFSLCTRVEYNARFFSRYSCLLLLSLQSERERERERKKSANTEREVYFLRGSAARRKKNRERAREE